MRYAGVVLIVPILVALLVPPAHAEPARAATRTQAPAVRSDTDRAPNPAPAALEARGSAPVTGSAKALREAPLTNRRGEEIAERARKVLLLLLGARRGSDAR
jgi:hypothetical protein